MTCRDWRRLSASSAAALYEAEIDRWSSTLGWDTRLNWTLVEAAREAGTAPGLVAEDDEGRVAGWCFYVLFGETLQIGAFVARTRAVTSALLDELLDSDHARGSSTQLLFAFADAEGLADELGARAFAVERYRYLQRPLEDCRDDVVGGRSWVADDTSRVARLFARAYPAVEPARPFVRHGRPDEWIDYVSQLVTTSACGRFQPGLSVVVDGAAGTDRVDAAVLVTRISRTTAHFAQVAVDPERQGTGFGRRIVGTALASARRAGLTRATLLVADGNAAAAELYRRLAFVETASFVSAVQDQPRRLSSAAGDTGGTSTFR